MKTRLVSTLLTLTVLALAAPSGQAADILTDGGFDSSGTIAGGTGNTTTGIENQGIASTWLYGAFGGENPGNSGCFKLDDVSLSVSLPTGMLFIIH